MTSVAGTSLILLLSPVLIALWAIPLFGERPGIRFRLWTLVAVIGASVVVLGGSSGPDGDPVGVTLAVISVVLLATQFVVTKVGRRTLDTVPLHIATVCSGAVFVTIFGLVTGHDFGEMTRTDFLCVLGVVALASTLSALLLTWSLRWLPAQHPSPHPPAHPVLRRCDRLGLPGRGDDPQPSIRGRRHRGSGVAAALLSKSGRRLLEAGLRSRPTGMTLPIKG